MRGISLFCLLFVLGCVPLQQISQNSDKNGAASTESSSFQDEQITDDGVNILKGHVAKEDTQKDISTATNQTPDLTKGKEEGVYSDLIKALIEKNYQKCDKILQEIGTSDEDFKYIQMLILDKLGSHDAPIQYWQQKVDHYLKAKGIEISNLAICTKIHGFGRFDRLPKEEFLPGASILIYIEVRRFLLKKLDTGKNKLALSYNWELFDSAGKKLPLWEDVPKTVREDEIDYNSDISDYYQSFLLPLPKNIAGGEYKLKVSVKDLNTNLSDSEDVKIQVLFVD
ncbi:MAG: hypothetical protein HY606_10095 [Planctomycetes bacterium]|nr:hypothetical protein [Planctomycetota bacterium]